MTQYEQVNFGLIGSRVVFRARPLPKRWQILIRRSPKREYSQLGQTSCSSYIHWLIRITQERKHG